MRFRLYLTLMTTAMVVLALMGYGAYTAHKQSDMQSAAIQRDARNLAHGIAAALVNDLITSRYDKIEGQLLHMAALRNVQDLVLADANGRILSHVVRSSHGETKAVYDRIAQPIDLTKPEVLGETHYTFLLPIYSGTRLGWVRVTSSLAELAQLQRQIWKDTLVASLLTALCFSVVLGLLLRKPARDLENATAFAGGLLHHKRESLQVRTRVTELTALERALNEVSHALARQFEQRRDSDERRGATLEASLDCLIAIDEESRIVEFNPSAETTFGWRRDEVLGKKMDEFIVPATHRSAHAQGMHHYLTTGVGPVLRKRIEITALRRDGSEFPIELSIVPFHSGGRQFFLGSMRDISRQKLLELEQQRTAATLRQTVSDLAAKQFALDQHAIVSITDLQGSILYANEKFLQISGYSSAELLGRNHRVVKSGLHDSAFYQEMWRTIASGNVWHGEIANRRKNGEIYWVASTIVPMLDENEVPCQYISIRTDITAQKGIEQKLAQNQSHLERLVEQSREAQRATLRAQARELEIGSQIQRTLLFDNPPSDQRSLSIAAHNEPSRGVDGDFVEHFRYDTRYFDIVIGDVMGKGVPAALVGAAVKQQLNRVAASVLARSESPRETPAPEVLVNSLHEQITSRLMALETFVTLTYLRVDVERSQVTFVNAGHTHTILSSTKGLQLLAGDNLPLGVMENERYVQSTVPLCPGDLLFLYSDGVTEARDTHGVEFGIERLTRLVDELRARRIPASIVVHAVRRALHDFVQHAEQSDDRTCMALYFHGEECAAPLLQIDLPWRMDGLTPMRNAIAAQAVRSGLDEVARDALVLAAFEVATNAIRHTPDPLPAAVLHCRLEAIDDALAVDFFFIGPPFAPKASVPDLSGEKEGGFGLYIIRQSVDAVSYDSPASGICHVRLVKRRRAAGV